MLHATVKYTVQMMNTMVRLLCNVIQLERIKVLMFKYLVTYNHEFQLLMTKSPVT